MNPRATLTTAAIDPTEVLRTVGADEDGAVVLFLGVVRNHADGKVVHGLHYEAYEEMATDVLRDIAGEAAERYGVGAVTVVHRVGELSVGEVSVAIAISSAHRADAYDASRHVIEEIKKRLPIWKKERYADGGDSWVQGTSPRPAQRR